MTEYALFCGIDISCDTASVAFKPHEGKLTPVFTIRQTPAGFSDLARRLEKTGYAPQEVLVVMEATGSYWMRLALHLHNAGFAVSVINPLRANGFARALLKRAKTDAVDAQTLAELAEKLQPDLWSPPPAIYEELRQRLNERDALVGMRVQQKNRLHALERRSTVILEVRARLMAMIDYLNAQISLVEKEIHALLHNDSEWGSSAQQMLSITGFGDLTVAWTLVATVNFTNCENARAVSAFAGLVPNPRQSGTSVYRKGHIGYAGHARLRRALYMAAISAVRHNPIAKTFYNRLIEKGKLVKVALCAVAHKLLRIAFALVKKGEMFNPQFAANLPQSA